MLFAAAAEPYEDIRVEIEDWQNVKHKAIMGALPLLEFEDQKMCQSLSIARYLAKKFGFSGKTDLEQFRADMIVDCIEYATDPMRMFGNYRLREYMRHIARFTHITQGSVTEEQANELRNTYINEQLPYFLDQLEELLKANHGGDGFFVGEDLTWADLHFLCFDGRLDLYVGLKKPLEKHPKLKALVERISRLPRIADWLTRRPITVF